MTSPLLPVLTSSRELYESLPDIGYESPILVIMQMSDGYGNYSPVCWMDDGHSLRACIDPADSYICFYIDERGDLYGIGNDIRYGYSFCLFRVFRPGISREEQLWLCDLIGSTGELDGSIMEEVNRCTCPIGMDVFKAGIS